ncbi:MAG: glycosyltransferase family 39 protein, partial [Desulfobacterales bacterium]
MTVSKQHIAYIRRKTVFKIWPEIVICFFLILATLTVYWQVRNHEFIGYDDDGYVTENPLVKNALTLNNIIWAFKSTHKSNWHPLTWLSHMLDVQLFGMNPGHHHMTSVLFHILNSLLLFAVFNRMTGKLWQSGFVAAMFALHPLHVESVVWVSERKDVLSTFFWMLALWSYARYAEHPDMNRSLPVMGFFALGLMAKPMVVTLPFVLLLLDFWPLKRIQIHASPDITGNPQLLSLSRVIWEKTPLFFLSLISCVVTFFVQKKGGAISPSEIHPIPDRLINTLISYTKYIQKMIWPDNLAILYPYPSAIYWWQAIGAFVLLSVITFLAIRNLKKLPWFGVGWFWYLGTLVPVIG